MTDPGADIAATIALWRAQGLSAEAAWRALGQDWGWAVEWRDVRAFMRRWVQAGAWDAAPPQRRAA